MLRIRLRRTGARKRPNYRFVVTESTAPRDGQFIEIIGFYDPLTEPATVRVDGDKAKTWLSKGASPSERVARLFAREGIIEAKGAPAPQPEPPPAPAPKRRSRKAAEPAERPSA